ncbi:hypothetical protein Aab01nite_41250 [Paractinoplanes abujensis]|uniref:Uncharacterized protein n=1 Tax=Paractinoplanes abujensis TaxID=882441 RepID=A0A7W7G2W1_9ACTN|nr:hypothetical protein [Actinoplanes abujensis]GID20535.1 hypothetical protein Aab01nite_41250 [Actinoplanes abujensis]
MRGGGSLVVRDRTAPVTVGLKPLRNEWYGYKGAGAAVNGTELTARIPRRPPAVAA